MASPLKDLGLPSREISLIHFVWNDTGPVNALLSFRDKSLV